EGIKLIGRSRYCSGCFVSAYIPEDKLVLIRDVIRVLSVVPASLGIFCEVCCKGGVFGIRSCLQGIHSLFEVLRLSICCPVVECIAFRCGYGHFCLRAGCAHSLLAVLPVSEGIKLIGRSRYCSGCFVSAYIPEDKL